MAAFLANVGVNAGHRVRSPLAADGSFRLHPIPERQPWAPPMLRLPELWGGRGVHLDPDLASSKPTYGDNCRTAGRAFSLRRAGPGDLIVFLARLHDPAGRPGFHLVGALPVAEILADVTADPGPGWWDANAHVRRSRAGAPWDRFWVFCGTPASGLFARAEPFNLAALQRLLPGARERSGRTALQHIGSHTRAVRRFEGAAEEALRSLCPS